MASTPLAIGTEVASLNLNGTPRPIFGGGLMSPTRLLLDSSPAFTLNLVKVLGTTTSSTSGFDFNADTSSFVTCAGSVVVLHQIDSERNISQRFFRAHPSASPPLVLPEPGTPTKRDRRTSQLSPIRPSTFGSRNPIAPSSPATPGTPGKGGARQGSRAAACVSLSRNGKTLAVGEVGYNPQIYIFSCVSDSQFPVTTLSEHSFGVKCVALSADAKWLSSVGDIHDGYIFVWSLATRTGTPKLQGSNKCTSTVNAMVWMGKSIVTVGVRHVKVWRPDLSNVPSPTKSKFKSELTDSPSSSPGSRTLNGRNCILGPLLESNFTCVATLSESRAVIATDKGEICVLDDEAGAQKMIQIRKISCSISCIGIDEAKKEVWFAGSNGQLHYLGFDELDNRGEKSTRTPNMGKAVKSTAKPNLNTSTIIGLGLMKDYLVALDSARCIRLTKRYIAPETLMEYPSKNYPSHQGAVLASLLVPAANSMQESFMTYDSTGLVMIWSKDGQFQSTETIRLEQIQFDESVELNELKIARFSPSGQYLIAGDKYGILSVIRWDPWTSAPALRAHQGEINDLTFCQLEDGSEVMASCGRDRTVQLFELKDSALQLLQTLDQHASSVTCVAFGEKGKMLFTASSDRTVGTFALANNEGSKAYLALRMLTLKQSPLSLVLDPKQPNTVQVTAMDKQLHVFDNQSGQCLASLRTADEKQTNPVLLSSVSTGSFEVGSGPIKRVLIGVSPTDKSLRVHETETGVTLAREHGHSEGVSGTTILTEASLDNNQQYRIASTGLDGTVMIWDLSYTPRTLDPSNSASPIHESPALAHPLRRVLSKSAFAGFSKSLEADGMSPIPPPTPSRGTSPTRARNRLSMVPSAGVSSKPQTPRLSRVERSPSPNRVNSPRPAPRRFLSRSKSVEAFHSAEAAADQLCKGLREFQRKMANSSTDLNARVARELEKELASTMDCIGRRGKQDPNARDDQVGELLGLYADRLAQLVERKVSFGITGRPGLHRSSLGSSTETLEQSSEFDESDESPLKAENSSQSA